MNYSLKVITLIFLSLVLISLQADDTVLHLNEPAQDQGLPYTRSAHPQALAKIKNEIAVFAGSRYGYVRGYKVRLNSANLLGGEAILQDGKILVPASFGGALNLGSVTPPPAPPYLAAKWVYDLGIPHQDGAPVDLAALASAKGLKFFQDPSGLLLIGKKNISFSPQETSLKEDVITLFDTPEKFADPDIATKLIPLLANQGKMTDHVKVTPEQIAILNGPETEWPLTPASDYDLSGFNTKLLGSPVPAPGVYPRLLFSAQDIPMLADRLKNSKYGQMSLAQIDYLFKKSWWDPTTSDGQLLDKLAAGDTTGLEFDSPPDSPPCTISTSIRGEKSGIFSTHISYVPECLTDMALYCLLTNDDLHGRKAAAALATYYKMREPILDEINAISDSEFGSSMTLKNGAVVPMNGLGAETSWRTINAFVAHMDLGLSLDFAGKWMTPQEKDAMRRFIAKACYGRRSYAQDGSIRFRDINWMGWDLPHYIANQVIEGLPGFDPEVSAAGRLSLQAFLNFGIDENGVIYESNGKTPGSLQFITLSTIISARRGDNYFGHPHLRKLLTGQIEMTSPSGWVTVNSGTQYIPFSRQYLSFQFVDEMKAFFPDDKRPDYLLGRAPTIGGEKDEAMREWIMPDDLAAYQSQLPALVRLRLPSPTYPGFTRSFLYDTDINPATTRADLNLPLDFDDPVHGVYSSFSDATPQSAWINLLVRPDHYLGAGHHHADAGMFHFSALGIDWFTQSPFDGEFSGKYFNLVQVDGHSEPEGLPGVNAYNGAATYLGSVLNSQASAGTANLTYAYSYRWLTQPPKVWTEALKALPWELDPSPNLQKIFAGTARYKLREWWANYNLSNYIATSRAPFNPMEYVFRTAGLVRGAHPYGFIVDDLKKDENSHLYQWVAMLNGGVAQADVPGLPANCLVLAQGPDHDSLPGTAPAQPPMISPQNGDSQLLVCALNLGEKPADKPAKDNYWASYFSSTPTAAPASASDPSTGQKPPLMQVERLSGPMQKNGKPSPLYDRLTISSLDKIGTFQILLLPYHQGEPLPTIQYQAQTHSATVHWPDQTDQFHFQVDARHRTEVTVQRNGQTLVQSK